MDLPLETEVVVKIWSGGRSDRMPAGGSRNERVAELACRLGLNAPNPDAFHRLDKNQPEARRTLRVSKAVAG